MRSAQVKFCVKAVWGFFFGSNDCCWLIKPGARLGSSREGREAALTWMSAKPDK